MPGAVALAVFVGAAASGAVIHGCSIYDSTLLVAASSDASMSDDAGDAAQQDSAAPDSAADAGWCGVQPPVRPLTDDGTQDLTFSVALHTLDFGASADAGVDPSLGYDLDGVCTCPGPGSCQPYMGDERLRRGDGAGQLDRSALERPRRPGG